MQAQEGAALKDPHTTYYAALADRLDVVLSFTEHDACDAVFPFNVMHELLETQTIASCEHVFDWLEARASSAKSGCSERRTACRLRASAGVLELETSSMEICGGNVSDDAHAPHCGRRTVPLSRSIMRPSEIGRIAKRGRG